MIFGYTFTIRRERRPLRGLQAPLRVAHLSDLHIGFFIRQGSVRRWVEATLAEQPDLIVITGDLTDARPEQVLPTLPELRNLKAPLGTWAVWGNHDYRFNHYQPKYKAHAPAKKSLHNPPKVPMVPPLELEQRLNQLGVRFLHNAGVQLRDDLYLAGVEDWWHGEPNVEQALATHTNASACLLICHNPDYLYQVPKSVDLTLCGHTHGGQVVLPWYGPAFTSSLYGQQFAGGWVDDPVPAFISRGLGVSTAPLRVACPAELVIHDFLPLSGR
ncbi:MAG: metallophosphoesterase [Meiothermus sp.]|uniref:metallophosphoesterase n=1 Tax=Meiothermus sp. TaxID=1955249 RepID=UPI0025DD920F|nr:metallophosphoesterase [Meiothermus sp.]MCS7057458.1 metallophosphoesterase [Meiothermus sp.]MDW8424390.1 metallophosphoesterase [Meiothermus sp.]